MNKTTSQNFKKKIFRSKVTAKSIIHSNFFSPLFQKDLTNSEWKQFYKETVIRFCDNISNFRYALFHLVLPRNKKVESI